MSFLKKIIPPFIYLPIFRLYYERHLISEYQLWESEGSPLPPPHKIKQYAIWKIAKQSGIKIFLETGTYKGDMLNAVKCLFRNLHSIELDGALYQKAKGRFKNEKQKIRLYRGDSGDVLPGILKKIQEPAIFWLDGHYSGGHTAKGKKTTPILAELEAISQRTFNDIILIDDARLFNGQDDYPEMGQLKGFIEGKFGGAKMEVRDDMIIIK